MPKRISNQILSVDLKVIINVIPILPSIDNLKISLAREYPDKSSMEVAVYSSFTNEKLILMEL